MELDETRCTPLSISNLLQCPVRDDVNIEEGLCKPQDENLFLLSSIAFLQKHLVKKLENETKVIHDDEVEKRYSDLLLVESGQKFKRQKCFIRLPNMEKFDEVLKSEACLPQKLLSNTQLLPLPKKSRSTKLSLTNIFKHKSCMEMENSVPKKSCSVFNIFRKSSTSTKSSETNVSSCETSTHKINPDKYIIFDSEDYVRQSVCSLASLSSLKENIQQATRNECINTNTDEIVRFQPLSHRQKNLSDIEEEILKVIPTETNLEIKKSINEKLRVSKSVSQSSLDSYRSSCDVKFVRKEDDFLEDLHTGIKFKCIPQLPERKIREQQSKLSVCIEDEPESDTDLFLQHRNYPVNITDSVKPIVSSETIQVIMSELLYQIEDRIQK